MEATQGRWRLIALVLTILSVTSSTAFGVRIVSYNVLNYSGVGREEAFQSVLLDTPPPGLTETKGKPCTDGSENPR